MIRTILFHVLAALTLLTIGFAAPVPALAQDTARGQQVYQEYCAACHAPENIMVSSPKLNNTAQWSLRLEPGLDHVIGRAMTGFGAMPAKGLCEDCSVDDIEAAIRYMAAPALETSDN
ncbi:c-type cytochrome [Mameliella alba]|nr:c-type cytochrome [Mameliella alba]MBY6171571.1 c-type cytochrome [Mameliella alba]MBY6176796.1 c-type cytochrome [Mameliella alba]